jgi:TPR repeat protein
MLNLGIVYQEGLGVPKDHAEAAHWFRKGAEGGSAGAMANLATLYHNGAGVEKDPVQGAAWMFQALQNGNQAAVETLTTYRKAYVPEFRKAMQRHLQEAGLFSGPVDGVFGPSTLAAFKELAARGTK